MRKLRRCRSIIALLVRKRRSISLMIILMIVTVVGWNVYAFFSHPLPGATVVSVFGRSGARPLERRSPDGIAFAVDPGPAVFALDLGSEDAHSRQVFPDYASALRYAHAHDLPTIPSVSVVLAACRVTDDRLQIALEKELDQAKDDGRSALLRRWLDLLRQRRAAAASANQAAYDGAIRYLSNDFTIGGAGMPHPTAPGKQQAGTDSRDDDPPLGPWASSPELSAIWSRDRSLAQSLQVTDDEAAATAAVLARCLADDPMLEAGWALQAAVARALLGPASRTTLEAVATRLVGIPTEELAGPISCAIVRKMVDAVHDTGVAPGAVSSTASPEEAILSPLGMSAWEDPLGTLVAAIRAGKLKPTPASDAGFYRHRWFALESLAAPEMAPEHRKLQLSTAYAERWQRAFAAGFTEGRSSLVKRLPMIYLGMGPQDPPTRVAVAPEFSAEPVPVLYLRLSRAYRALNGDLDRALGPGRWRTLRDGHGELLATTIERRAQILFGLACLVYREIGFPMPLMDDEGAIDREAAQAVAAAWCAGTVQDPDLGEDARMLVPLVADGHGRHRCPAIAGVRLEPVEYRWVDKPLIAGDIAAVWTPARLWLASPCPVMVTLDHIPPPKEFRARCDDLHTVAQVASAFGGGLPHYQLPARRMWPWVLGALLCCASAVLAMRWWLHQRWLRRIAAAVLTCALAYVLLVRVAMAPPYWLIYAVTTRVLTAHDNLALVLQWRMNEWSGEKSTRLFFDLFSDPDPQLRYLACWLHLKVSLDDRDESHRSLLRSAIDDDADEVARYSWAMLCANAQDTPTLLSCIDDAGSAEVAFYRLSMLSIYRPADPQVIAYAIHLTDGPPSERRSNAFRCLDRWKRPADIIKARLRRATSDLDPRIRVISASRLGKNGSLADIPVLTGMWQDDERDVRLTAFNALWMQISPDLYYPSKRKGPPQWADPAIQAALTRYAADDRTTCDELLTIGRWLADPAALRACCLRALPMAKQLPPFKGLYPHVENVVKPGWSRETAMSSLVARWFLADHYAQQTIDDAWEVDHDLVRSPWLLTRLAEGMEARNSTADVLEILRQGMTRPDCEQPALWFVERLGPQAASLAAAVQVLYEHAPIRETRIGCLNALEAMGDPVARLALPYLDVIAKDPDEGWWAVRMRDRILHRERP